MEVDNTQGVSIKKGTDGRLGNELTIPGTGTDINREVTRV